MFKRVTKMIGFGLKGESGETRSPSLRTAMEALGQSAAEAPKPTLVCRQCGLKYENTGTFLQGSRCPDCHRNG